MSYRCIICALLSLMFFFFNDTATTEIYTLSLHDALPISMRRLAPASSVRECSRRERESGSRARGPGRDRLARDAAAARPVARSEEHTSELQSQSNLVCRLLLEKKKDR